MKISELRAGLQNLKLSMSVWQCKKTSIIDFDRLDSLMANYDGLTVAQFCSKIEKLLSEENGGKSSAVKKREINIGIIEKYQEKLSKVDDDRVLFQEVLSKLAIDKKVRIPELQEIASNYTGVDNSSRKKSDIISAIEKKFQSRKDTDRRLKHISDIF